MDSCDPGRRSIPSNFQTWNLSGAVSTADGPFQALPLKLSPWEAEHGLH